MGGVTFIIFVKMGIQPPQVDEKFFPYSWKASSLIWKNLTMSKIVTTYTITPKDDSIPEFTKIQTIVEKLSDNEIMENLDKIKIYDRPPVEKLPTTYFYSWVRSFAYRID